MGRMKKHRQHIERFDPLVKDYRQESSGLRIFQQRLGQTMRQIQWVKSQNKRFQAKKEAAHVGAYPQDSSRHSNVLGPCLANFQKFYRCAANNAWNILNLPGNKDERA